MKKVYVILSLLLVASFVLSGCTPSAEEPVSPAKGHAEEKPAAEESAIE